MKSTDLSINGMLIFAVFLMFKRVSTFTFYCSETWKYINFFQTIFISIKCSVLFFMVMSTQFGSGINKFTIFSVKFMVLYDLRIF